MSDDDVLVGRYRRLSALGAGGMGEVWLAEDLELGRRVAIKRLHVGGPGSSAPDPDLVERMIREARVVARLNHPAIVTLHDLVRVDGSPYLIMEYVEGESLAERIAREHTLDWRVVAPIVAEIAAALGAAHRAGVLHRDIKPANILLDLEGHAHLADFGIARGDGDAAITRAGELVGTVAYLAPDIARGEPASPASDIWSLGATFFAATEGSAPFAGSGASVAAMIARLIQHDAPPPRQAGPLTPLLTRMLATDPAARPAAPEVVSEVPRLLALPHEDTGQHSVAPSSPVTTEVPYVDPATDQDPPTSTMPEHPTAAIAGPPVSPAPIPPAPHPPAPQTPQTPQPPQTPSAPRRSRGQLIAFVVLLVAVAALGSYLGLRADDKKDDGAGSTGSTPAAGSSTPSTPSTTDSTDSTDTGSPGAPKPGDAGFGSVTLGKDATRAVLSPDGSAAYVANTGSNTVSIVDTTSGKVETVEVGAGPLAVTVSSDGSRVYVPCRNSNEIRVLDVTASPVTTTTIALEAGPAPLTLTPDDSTLIAPTSNGFVYLIDTGTQRVGDIAVSAGSRPRVAVLSTDGATAYVPDSVSRAVVAFDLADPGSPRTIDLSGAPLSLDRTADGTRAYAPDRAGQILPIDLESESALPPIQLPGTPGRLALSKDASHAWVADFSNRDVLLVDLADGIVEDTFDIGEPIGPVEIDPTGSIVAVADAGAGDLMVIDTTTLEVRHLAAGDAPGLVTSNGDGSIFYVVSDTAPATFTAVPTN